MKKIYNSTIVQTIITLIVTFLLINGGNLLGYPLYLVTLWFGNDTVSFMAMYASFIGIWILTFIVWGIVKKYRCLFGILGSKPKGNRFSTALPLGLIFGIGINLLIACVAMLCGSIRLEFNEINIVYIIIFIIVVGIQSGAEELITRGHLYQNLRRIFPNYPIVAIAGNALFFSLMHASNTGVTILALINVFLSGIMFSLMVYYFDSFWGPVIAHTGWNFCQSIILGLPNSGKVSDYSIFTLDAANARNGFAYNTGFGIEGTVASVIVLSLSCIALYLIGRKRNLKPFDVWAVPAKAVSEQPTQSETVELSTETVNEQKETEK